MFIAILGWAISLALLGTIVVSSADRRGISPPFQKGWRVHSTIEWVIEAVKTIAVFFIVLIHPLVCVFVAAMVVFGAMLGAPGFMLGLGWGWVPVPVLIIALLAEVNERYEWWGTCTRSRDNY